MSKLTVIGFRDINELRKCVLELTSEGWYLRSGRLADSKDYALLIKLNNHFKIYDILLKPSTEKLIQQYNVDLQTTFNLINLKE